MYALAFVVSIAMAQDAGQPDAKPLKDCLASGKTEMECAHSDSHCTVMKDGKCEFTNGGAERERVPKKEQRKAARKNPKAVTN